MVYGNAGTILGFLITFIACCWIQGRQVAIGLTIIPLLLIKSLGLNWCPLLLLKRIQWKTLFIMAILTLLFNGITLYFAGIGIYQHYFSEILPLATRPIGQGFVFYLFRFLGIYPTKLYLGLTIALCCFIYWGYYRASKNTSANIPASTLAALAGTMAIFCLLNFSVWSSYHSLYLYFPFLGWMLWEIEQTRGKWKIALGIGLISNFFLMLTWIFNSLRFHFGFFKFSSFPPEFFPLLLPFLQSTLVPLFVLTVAFRRLFFLKPEKILECVGTEASQVSKTF